MVGALQMQIKDNNDTLTRSINEVKGKIPSLSNVQIHWGDNDGQCLYVQPGDKAAYILPCNAGGRTYFNIK